LPKGDVASPRIALRRTARKQREAQDDWQKRSSLTGKLVHGLLARLDTQNHWLVSHDAKARAADEHHPQDVRMVAVPSHRGCCVPTRCSTARRWRETLRLKPMARDRSSRRRVRAVAGRGVAISCSASHASRGVSCAPMAYARTMSEEPSHQARSAPDDERKQLAARGRAKAKHAAARRFPPTSTGSSRRCYCLCTAATRWRACP
jgi:hypothetical protein